jgi:hypothetical protein
VISFADSSARALEDDALVLRIELDLSYHSVRDDKTCFTSVDELSMQLRLLIEYAKDSPGRINRVVNLLRTD